MLTSRPPARSSNLPLHMADAGLLRAPKARTASGFLMMSRSPAGHGMGKITFVKLSPLS
jgi:hypothetical protein